jgi:hypothetical protein
MHYQCTDLFIEVNLRHRRFYEVMLGFKAVGEPRMNASINMPVQLMWLNVGEIRRYIDRFAGEKGSGKRSLYPYFFSAKEEQGIYGRLAGFAGGGEARLQAESCGRTRISGRAFAWA